eukprot:jgi/Hompol1/3461/HPOL_006547-RA
MGQGISSDLYPTPPPIPVRLFRKIPGERKGTILLRAVPSPPSSSSLSPNAPDTLLIMDITGGLPGTHLLTAKPTVAPATTPAASTAATGATGATGAAATIPESLQYTLYDTHNSSLGCLRRTAATDWKLCIGDTATEVSKVSAMPTGQGEGVIMRATFSIHRGDATVEMYYLSETAASTMAAAAEAAAAAGTAPAAGAGPKREPRAGVFLGNPYKAGLQVAIVCKPEEAGIEVPTPSLFAVAPAQTDFCVAIAEGVDIVLIVLMLLVGRIKSSEGRLRRRSFFDMLSGKGIMGTLAT